MKFPFSLVLSLLSLFSCSTGSKKASIITGGNYDEQHRPQFHFSPPKAWMNDPNGLVYYKGEYHLFYQYYPDSTVWGPMHWGHAVSTDLVYWQHLPVALYPDSLGCIFSGSAVVDEQNTSGFAPPNCPEKPLVAIFTYHNLEWERAGRLDRESQGIAYSLDRGRTWTKYVGNPVIKNKGDVNFRDPKVFWHKATQTWVMTLAVGDHIEIITSKDLKNWEKRSEFGQGQGAHGGTWECPDLFPTKSKDGIEKWVLIQNMDRGAVNGGSGTQYFVGDFDGKAFKNDNPPDKTLWLDYGTDNYAGITWFGAPDNRRIFIGWMSNWDDYAQIVPTLGWRSALTVPRELWLENTDDGPRLFQWPVVELEKLRFGKWTWEEPTSFNEFMGMVIPAGLAQYEVNITFDLSKSSAQQMGFELKNRKGEQVKIGYDHSKREFFIDRTNSGKVDFSKKFPAKHTAPYEAKGLLKIYALVDVSSVEVFVDDGRLAMTEIFFPNEDFSQLHLFTTNNSAWLEKAEVYGLKSIWRK